MVTGLLSIDEPQVGTVASKKVMVCDRCGEHEGQFLMNMNEVMNATEQKKPADEIWYCRICKNIAES